MSVLRIFQRATAPDAPATMEENFAILKRHGVVRLVQFDDGEWMAGIRVYVRTPGATFEVKSGLKHETPAAALAELVQLTLKAITTIGETV